MWRRWKCFYALENPFSVNRHWRNGQVNESAGGYSAPTPVMNADEYLFAFANVAYQSGIVVSSPLQAVIPAKLGAAATIKAPSRVFYEGTEGLDGWTSNSTGTDPIPSAITRRLKTAIGPDGKPGFTPDRVSPMNYAPSDPEFRAPKGALLQFDIKTDTGEEFQVKLHKNYWVDDFSTWSCSVESIGDSGWQTVTLSGAQFIIRRPANRSENRSMRSACSSFRRLADKVGRIPISCFEIFAGLAASMFRMCMHIEIRISLAAPGNQKR